MEQRASADTVRQNTDFWYVYILTLNNGRHYVGGTSNLDARILCHTKGLVQSTKAHLPMELL
jgi:putative endonuclease